MDIIVVGVNIHDDLINKKIASMKNALLMINKKDR
mgnify:CR=1 FL=1